MKSEQRYRDDATFYTLVNMLKDFIRERNYGQDELNDAVTLACILRNREVVFERFLNDQK